MHPHAAIAIRAAKLKPTIGWWAAMRFVQRNNVPMRLYILAQILEAAQPRAMQQQTI